MKAVEAGAKEWHEAQMKLRAQRDAMKAHAERTDPRNLLSRARADNVDIEIDHGHGKDRRTYGTCTLRCLLIRFNLAMRQHTALFQI